MENKYLNIFYALLIQMSVVWPANIVSAQSSNPKVLILPKESLSYETPDIGVGSVFISSEAVFLSVQDRPHFLKVPFSGLGKTRESTFGNLLAAKRLPIEGISQQYLWTGISMLHSKRLMFLDGIGLRLATVSLEEPFQTMSLRSIAWDRIKPARDPRGEPTHHETKKLRADFASKMKKIDDLKFSGLSALNDTNTEFLMPSRIPGFPLLLLKCNPKDSDGSCWVDRKCFLPNPSDRVSSSISGIAFDKKTKTLLLGDRKQNHIHVYKVRSCFDIDYKSSLSLPDALKKLTGLHIDQNQRLWVSTEGPDNYLNASLYVWESSALGF